MGTVVYLESIQHTFSCERVLIETTENSTQQMHYLVLFEFYLLATTVILANAFLLFLFVKKRGLCLRV